MLFFSFQLIIYVLLLQPVEDPLLEMAEVCLVR